MIHRLDGFRTLVLSDEAQAMELARLETPAEFTARALEAAGRAGLALDAADLAAAGAPDPAGILRMARTWPNARAWPPRQWLPVHAAGGVVDWAHFAGAPLAEPFFTASALCAIARPFNRLFRYVTRFDDFIAERSAADSLAPDGFIFHMSRCGSTLVSQMLAALPGAVAVSEAAPLDAAAGTGSAEALKAMVAALGRRRRGDEARYFLKLDFAHALALPLFRQAFPGVPWIFLYRDPVEVLVSQMRLRGPQLASPDLPAEEACARGIAKVCEAATEAMGAGGGLAVNYADLPDAAQPILAHFGFACTEAERAAMAAATRRDVKRPEADFVPDARAKREAAGAAVRDAAARHLTPLYRRLEALRYSGRR